MDKARHEQEYQLDDLSASAYHPLIANEDARTSAWSASTLRREHRDSQDDGENSYLPPRSLLYDFSFLLPAKLRIWIHGPYKAKPFVIATPLLIRRRFFKRFKDKYGWLVVAVSILCFAGAVLSLLILSYSGCEVAASGKALKLSCISRPWKGQAECGIDGLQCRPFRNASYAFYCPSDCGSVKVLEPYTIGNRVINYHSLVIGGRIENSTSFKNLYRGDSFICAAAIHAGLIEGSTGGPGIIKLLEDQHHFPSESANGLQSVAFAPHFPLSFALEDANHYSGLCRDPRWFILASTIVFNIYMILWNRSPAIFFWSTFVSAYFCVALASDAPEPQDYAKVISLAIQGLLPATFVGHAIYYFCVRRILSSTHALSSGQIWSDTEQVQEMIDVGIGQPIRIKRKVQDAIKTPNIAQRIQQSDLALLETSILWLSTFWVGALNNFTFDKLPLQRLTPRDIGAQPGGIAYLSIIIIIILAIAIGQAWALRREGRLPQFLALYTGIGIFLLVLLALPNLSLRLHHYIIALILLPGTAIQTRPSALYQGLLVGLFINGIARWGFASILETPSELFKTDPNGLVPQTQIQVPHIAGSNISFSWSGLRDTAYDSISVLVNDVERYRGPYGDHDAGTFAWTRRETEESEFFRFAYVKYGELGGDTVVGKYTRPGTWLSNGTWIPPEKEDG